MKEETNSEMDLLLRRLGGRPEASVSGSNGDINHLDTDELSAYAENVLPAAARTRYTEHLAECARCRELVVQLSSSAGVVSAVETLKAPMPSALRKFLASLFSPLVLRYAVPALGLIVVATIGIFVLRPNKNGEQIAQTAEAPKPTSAVTQNAQEQKSTTPSYNQNSTDQTSPASKPARASGSPENQVAAAAPKAPPPPAAASGTVVDSLAKEQQQPVATDSPAALASLKPGTTTEAREQQAKIEARVDTAQGKFANEPPAEKSAETAKVKAEDRKEGETNAAGAAPSSANGRAFKGDSAQEAARSRTFGAATAAKDKDRDDSNTTTVAGRHFRKQGGVWVDTAYNFSRSAISVTRDSEQYRALVADEPAIKTIADQLDGEILVLWKGRAYRIK